tara:strand:+ start:3434 stop:3655 length:222 start_codon:yes stop_codon:yes gene_type:complete
MRKLSYEDWKQYVHDTVQKNKLNKIPLKIKKLENELNKIDSKFLGKHNLFMDIKYIKRKTEEIYKRSQEIINK